MRTTWKPLLVAGALLLLASCAQATAPRNEDPDVCRSGYYVRSGNKCDEAALPMKLRMQRIDLQLRATTQLEVAAVERCDSTVFAADSIGAERSSSARRDLTTLRVRTRLATYDRQRPPNRRATALT